MPDEFKNYVDGKWVAAASGATFPSLNPANKGDVLGVFPRSDHRDVDRAAESAHGHADRWRLVAPRRRAAILHRAADLLRERRADLALLVTRETGTLLREAEGEAQEAGDLVADLAGEGTRPAGPLPPAGPPGRLAVRVCVPVGVVAAITPSSGPLAVPAGILAAALAAGNAVVLKPSEDAPLAGTRLVEILLEAGLPPGVVSLVHGTGEEAGAPLVRHPNAALVAFHGSAAVGREVAIACAAEGKRTALAAGGAGALLVMDDADLDLALEGALRGAFAAAGQRRAAVRRLILHKKIAREFTERLAARAAALRVGDGMAPATEMGPLVNEARLKRMHAFTRLGVKEGARLLCGGEVVREGECKRGFFYLPTVLGEARPAMRIAQEEILGPAVCILTAPDLEGAVAVANGARPPLVVGLYARDLSRAFQAAQELRAGHVTLNAPPPGGAAHPGLRATDPVAPFTEWRTMAADLGGRPVDDAGA